MLAGQDRSTWRIDFDKRATRQQQDAAKTALLSFDPNSKTPEEIARDNDREIVAEFLKTTPETPGDIALQAFMRIHGG